MAEQLKQAVPCTRLWRCAEEEKKDAEVLRGQKHYADAGVRTVVTTSAIAMNSDDDDSEGSDFEAEDTHTPLGVLAARGGRQNDAAVQEKADQRGSGSKRAASGKFKGNGKPSNVCLSLPELCSKYHL